MTFRAYIFLSRLHFALNTHPNAPYPSIPKSDDDYAKRSAFLRNSNDASNFSLDKKIIEIKLQSSHNLSDVLKYSSLSSP